MKRFLSVLLSASLTLSMVSLDIFADISILPSLTAEAESSVTISDSDMFNAYQVSADNTSVTLSWSVQPNAAYYVVIVDGVEIDSQIDNNTYSISNLETGWEYSVSVRAYDNLGVMISESEEISVFTDLTITSDYTLYKDIHINNLTIKSGKLSLNGYDVVVNGDAKVENGNIVVENSNLSVRGNFDIGGSVYSDNAAGISMSNSNGYVLVYGNINLLNEKVTNTLTAGKLEIKGNLSCSGNSSWISSGTHVLLFSGNREQIISAPESSRFGIVELKNFSTDGIVFSEMFIIEKLIDNGCVINVASGNSKIGWTLFADEVYDGSLFLSAGVLDLNGHKLTINGDFNHEGGTLIVNGGELCVKGDYLLQNTVEETVVSSSGVLVMNNPVDKVTVKGDYIIRAESSYDECLTNGTFEISGNIMQPYSYGNRTFVTSDNFTVVLNGNARQIVDMSSSNYPSISNLRIENTSEEGVEFVKGVIVTQKLYNTASKIINSKNIYVGSSIEFPDNGWDYDLTYYDTIMNSLYIGGSLFVRNNVTLYGDITVDGSLEIIGSLNLNGHIASVDNDVWVGGVLNINRGQMICGRDCNVAWHNTDYIEEYTDGYIKMCYAADYIFVGRNMLYYTDNTDGTFTAGSIEIKGDFTQKYARNATNNFYSRSNHKVIFSGNALQTISFESIKSRINILEIQNYSSEGVLFKTPVTAISILDNGCNILYYDPDRYTTFLSEDTIHIGDYILENGKLDLNGKKLTITGSFMQNSGEVFINNGTLVVNGNYTISGNSILNMTNTSDTVIVSGDFSMKSDASHNGLLTEGELFIGGNFSRGNGSSSNFKASDNHTIIFNGSEKQTVYSGANRNYSLYKNVKFMNTSVEGIEILDNMVVDGMLFNTTSSISNSNLISLSSNAVLADGRWNYDLTINGSYSIPDNDVNDFDFTVYGDLFITNTLRLNGNTVCIMGNLTLKGSGSLCMVTESDYLLVYGSMKYENSANNMAEISDGTIEVKGDFIQTGRWLSGTLGEGTLLILSGDQRQIYNVEANKFIISSIILQNDSEDGVLFASNIEMDVQENGCNVTYVYPNNKGWTLHEDECINGDFNLASGVLDLNGFKLTILGEFSQTGGVVYINGGELNVFGDYLIQQGSNDSALPSGGELIMNNASDVVMISGNFVMHSCKSHENNLSAGVMRISGNIIVPYTANNNALCCSGTHTIELVGDENQSIFIGSTAYVDSYSLYYSRFNNLKIQNTSESGVSIEGNIFVCGLLYNTDSNINNSRNIFAVSTTAFENNMWKKDISISGARISNVHICGDVYAFGIYVYGNEDEKSNNDNEYDFIVDGNLYFAKSLIFEKCSAFISGNLETLSVKSNGGYISSNVSNIYIGGNIWLDSQQYNSFNGGIIELTGNLVLGKYESINLYDNASIVFCGDVKQEVSGYIDNSNFNTIIIRNTSEEGVVFEKRVKYTNLITNGNRVVGFENDCIGWTLSQDEAIQGDINLVSGILDLAGHSLTIDGTLVQMGGTILLNGGSLIVNNDYIIGREVNNEITSCSGILNMTNETDHVCVGGNFVMFSSEAHEDYLTAGMLEIKGDFSQGGRDSNYKTSGVHTTVFAGNSMQTISTYYARFTNLKITNTSKDGLYINGRAFVSGKLYNSSARINGGNNLYTLSGVVFVDNSWNGDITISESLTTSPDIFINGSLYIAAPLILGGDAVVNGSVYVNSTLDINGNELDVNCDMWVMDSVAVNGGEIYIGNDLNVSSTSMSGSNGSIKMSNVDDYIRVEGSMYLYSWNCSYMNYGVIEVDGNLTLRKYHPDLSNVLFGISHKIVLNGSNIQNIDVNDSSVKFGTLEITKPLDSGYTFSFIPMWYVLVENYNDTTAPTVPSQLTLAGATYSSVYLQWCASTDDISECIYDIYRNGVLVASVSDNEYLDTSLEPETTYVYYIVSRDTSGNTSAASSTLDVFTAPTTAPSAPEKLTAKLKADDKIGLTWAGSSEVNIKYLIYRNGSLIKTTANTFYNDPVAELGYYEYYVISSDDNGNVSGASNIAAIDTLPPVTPILSIVSVSDSRITLSWVSEDNTNISHYSLYKNGIFYRNINDTLFTDTSFAYPGESSYNVVAYDVWGNASDKSNIVSAVAAEDNYAPQVTEFRYDNEKLSDGNNTIYVSCIDDIALSEFLAEVKASISNEWLMAYRCTISKASADVDFDLSKLNLASGIYDIRITLKDCFGNSSVYYNQFSYMENDLAMPILSYEVKGKAVQLTWNSFYDRAVVYSIYKRINKGNYSLIRKGITSNSFIDYNLNPTYSYDYYIVAEDDYENQVYSSVISVKVADDIMSPEVTEIYLADYSSTGRAALYVTARDNYALKTVTLQYLNNDEWTTLGWASFSGHAYETTFVEFGTSSLPEGTIQFRAYAEDFSGNVSNTADSPIFLLVIDKTPPAMPTGLTSSVENCIIQLHWNSNDDDVAYYNIYRRSFGSTEFSRVKKACTFNKWSDTAIELGVTYEYAITAVDEHGNESSMTSAVSSRLSEDLYVPEIISISPSDGLIGSNTIFSVFCRDNYRLGTLSVFLQEDTSTIQLYSKELEGNEDVVRIKLDTTYLNTGDCTLEFRLTDSYGNTGIPVVKSFNYSSGLLSTPELSAIGAGWSVELSWAMSNDTELDGYNIFRKASIDNDYVFVAAVRDSQYIDKSVVANISYDYYVEAIDIRGNSVSSNDVTVTPTSEDLVSPFADAGDDLFGIVGIPVSFDGLASSDNIAIASYYWDFGDGTSSVKSKDNHVFNAPGKYEVSLTVADAAGNSDTTIVEVTVYSNDHSAMTFTVTDNDGRALSKVNVYWTEGDEMVSGQTDTSGKYTFVAAGKQTYTIYFYKEGYLPVEKKCLLVKGISSETVFMDKEDIIAGKIETNRLNADELIERGIDIYDPDNQVVYECEIPVKYSTTYKLLKITVNQSGEIIGGNNSVSYEVNGQKHFVEFVPVTVPKTAYSYNVEELSGPTIFAYFSITTEFSALKDFFSVDLALTNNASDTFPIVNAYAELQLPEGLTVAKTISGSSDSLRQDIGTINGQETKNLAWLIVGDKDGTYQISADFFGTIMPFGEQVSAQFVTKEPIVVEKKSELVFRWKDTDASDLRFLLTNETSNHSAMSRLIIDMRTVEEFGSAKYIVIRYPSGLIEKIEWADENRTQTKRTIYLPVGIDFTVDIDDLRTLEYGESIEGIIY